MKLHPPSCDCYNCDPTPGRYPLVGIILISMGVFLLSVIIVNL